MDVDIDEPDWEILAGMGSGAEASLEATCIDGFDEAVEVCDVLQRAGAASGANYKLDDLICFLCLSQHKEATSNDRMPACARPVSIEEDLGLDALPPRGLQAPPPLVCDDPCAAQAAFPAPDDRAVQPLKARRWRADTLLQPLAQPPSRPFVSFALPIASVQTNMLPWLPIVSAVCLTQCCRSLHWGGGRYIAERLVDSRWHVEDLVSDIAFHPQHYVALEKMGITKSTILRMVACALDWLEECPRVFFEESLLPLALLRLGMKFEVDRDHLEAALQVLEPLDGSWFTKSELLSFECRLEGAIRSRRPGLPDGVECPPQPLAR